MATPTARLAAASERPRELLADLDLRDRAEELADELQKRSKVVAKRTRTISGEALDLAGDLRERIGDPRDRAVELREASEAVWERKDEVESMLRKVAVSLLEVFQALLRIALLLPRLAVRALGGVRVLAGHAEVARERGLEYSERARDFAHDLPMSRRMRWRRRFRTTFLVGGGFAVGFGVGWIMAQRAAADEIYDAPVGLQPVEEHLREIERDDAGDPADASESGEPEAGTGA